MDKLSVTNEQIVIFDMAGAIYGIPTDYIQEITRIVHVNPVPEAPDFVVGAIDYRGDLIVVIDLMKRLRIGEAKADLSSLFLIVYYEGRRTGLLIDTVLDVASLPVAEKMAAGKSMALPKDLICGAYQYKDALLSILNLGAILDFNRLPLDEPVRGVS